MDTNIKYLVDNGINIWNKDAYNYHCKNNKIIPKDINEFIKCVQDEDNFYKNKLGELGRVYGAQWRNWTNYSKGQTINLTYDKPIDQISNLIKGLKENPMGTKHIVTAWNPAELDDIALPPCHWSFEILVEPNFRSENTKIRIEQHNIPLYSFTLKWHQRSVDSFLGAPFNIASYALLAQIIGKMTNMIPKGIIGDLSNVHIYEPHLDAVKEQLSRDTDKYGKCELKIDSHTIHDLEATQLKHIDNSNIIIQNFNLDGYKSYPRIPAEMLAYNK